LVNFYNEMTHLIDEGRVVYNVYHDIRKAFDMISHKILMQKLMKYQPDEQAD